MKSLTEKAWAGPPNVNPFRLTAALGNRRDSTECLQVGGALVAISLRAEGGQEPGRQCWTRTRKGIEDGEIGMNADGFRNLPVKIGDPLAQCPDESHKYRRHRHRRLDQRLIPDGGNSCTNRFQPLTD